MNNLGSHSRDILLHLDEAVYARRLGATVGIGIGPRTSPAVESNTIVDCLIVIELTFVSILRFTGIIAI